MQEETTQTQDPLVGAVIDNLKPKTFNEFTIKLLKTASPVALPSHKANAVIPLAITKLREATQDIVCTDSEILFYSGICWAMVTPTEFGIFLKAYALKLGCPDTVVCPYWGVDALVRQAKIDLYDKGKPNRDVIAFENETLEIDTLKTRSHRREDYLRSYLPYSYNPQAECAHWLKTLDEVLPDKNVQKVFQEVASIGLARVHHEKQPYLFGDGLNGKSLVLEVVKSVYGRHNVSGFSFADVTDKGGNALAQMVGKLLNISTENGQKIPDTAISKAYISGEELKVRNLYQNATTTDDYAPSILSANNLPQTDDYSGGFFRRFLFIPFTQTIPKEKINPNLAQELKIEVSGIANWLLEGARRLRLQGKFSDSEQSLALGEEFRKETDAVFLFVDEQGFKPTDNLLSEKCELGELYAKFKEWCRDNGFGTPSIRTLGQRLRRLGFKVAKSSQNKTYVWYTTCTEPESGEEVILPF